jgi:hypothetical protein
MKKIIEVLLVLAAVIAVALAVYACFYKQRKLEDMLKILTFAAGFLFFSYKLLTGWLFINLNVVIEATRQNWEGDMDHLSLKVTLSKGNIDSLWLEDVEFRLSELVKNGDTFLPKQLELLTPKGIKKNNVKEGDIDWDGVKSTYYVLSPNEDAVFSTYTTIKKQSVILVEGIILGTRPFYGIQFRPRKPIQWKSSIIVLPEKK